MLLDFRKSYDTYTFSVFQTTSYSFNRPLERHFFSAFYYFDASNGSKTYKTLLCESAFVYTILMSRKRVISKINLRFNI